MFMTQLFLVSLLLIIIGALFIYRYTGKKRFLKFDLVQFIYAFIIAPLIFIWFKSFAYYLLQTEARVINQAQLFIADTAVSLLGLFVYAFVIVHFLTKNFEIKRYRDPLYDIFRLSEVIHLWISHLGLFFGGLGMATMLALLNIFFPLEIELSFAVSALMSCMGIILGLLLYVAVWLSNFNKSKFIKINKIIFAFHFFLLLSVYFIFDVTFIADFLVYWFFFFVYLGVNSFSIFFEKSDSLVRKFEKLHHKYQDGWSALENRFLHPK